MHTNSAFALALASEYAQQLRDDALADAICAKALGWFGADADCQAWEPGGQDFLSPALIEAECMRRVLAPAEFRLWLRRFLPRLPAGDPESLFVPAMVIDPSDGYIAHLHGLNLSRAWCCRSLAASLPTDDPARPVLSENAEHHLAESLPFVTGDYMLEHWLATYAVLALAAPAALPGSSA